MPASRFVALGTVLLLASCAHPMPSSPTSLAGTAWLAESIGGRGVVDRLQSTLRFDGEGRVSGNAGCNQLSGSYETDGAALSVGRLGMTKRMCAPAAMEQEQAFTAALERAARYAVSDDGFLLLTDADGAEVLRLAPHDIGQGDTGQDESGQDGTGG